MTSYVGGLFPRLVMPSTDALGRLAVALVFWLIVSGIAWAVTRYLLRWLTRQRQFEAGELVTETIRIPFLIAVVSYGTIMSWRYSHLDDAIATVLDQLHFSLVILLLAYVTWRLLDDILVANMKQRIQSGSGRPSDDLLIPLLSRIGPFVIILAVAHAIVSVFGGNLVAWLTGFGLATIATGYVFQDPIQGLFSGTYLSLDRPFKPGDLVILGDNVLYRVLSVGLRVTQLYDINRHSLVYVPNAKLAADKLINVARPTVEQRCVLTVTLPEPRDPHTAAALLIEACYAHENVLGDWKLKEPVLRRRIHAYLDRLKGLESATSDLPGGQAQVKWVNRRIERLNGELIRLHVEEMLRETGESFSKDLLRLARWASYYEHGGLDHAKREVLARHVEELMSKFDVLVEQITTWLYLIKTIEYHLIDESYDEPMRQFVERNVEQDGRLLLEELRACGFPNVPGEPITQRSDCDDDHRSDQEATRIVDREQFNDRAEFLDYQRLYTIWHRNVLTVYRELVALSAINRLEGSQELRLDSRVTAFERQFANNFLLNVGHWQLPTATLVDISDGKLKFDLVFFVDDALRDECHRVERVTTELLMEIDRTRGLYEASVNPRVMEAPAAAIAPGSAN